MSVKDTLTEILYDLAAAALDIAVCIVILLIAKLLVNLVSKITSKQMDRADNLEDEHKSKQIKTNMTVTHSANRYLIYLIAIILSLNVLGLGKEVSGAIVAAGIGGLVLSLGAQSIVKDMIAGIFLLFEKQYFVGDYVKIGDYEGTVLSIALRVTYLDSFGKKVIIPNGEIRDLINYNRTDGLALVIIPTPYNGDTRRIMKIIDDVVLKYYVDQKRLLTKNKPTPCEILEFGEIGVEILVKVETKPLQQWKVERQLRLLIKEELTRKKINMPYNKLAVKN